jgi:hypothetical protein
MPVRYSIDPPQQRIRTTCDGYVTFPEVAAHFQELRTDPMFRDCLDVLLDLTGCTSLPTPDQLRAVVDRITESGGRWRFGLCAIITADEALFGMSRIFKFTRATFSPGPRFSARSRRANGGSPRCAK